MTDRHQQEQREHDLTMQVFAVSAAMVGVCLTAIGILQVVAAQKQAQSLGDDLLALDALLFVTCCTLAFWSFKTRQPRLRQLLRWVVDILFLVGLFAMAGICAVIAYSIF